jgi:hypothetical protein
MLASAKSFMKKKKKKVIVGLLFKLSDFMFF